MKVNAYAKINLFLEITGKRTDGYHNIVSIMQKIGLYDELEITNRKDNKILLNIKGISVPPIKNNLIYKAASLMQKTFKVLQGANIKLIKNIPIGAGLGGGSSDAASVMMALNKLWKLNISASTLSTLGKNIGADVPFFFYGNTCYVRGIGEKVKVLPNLKKTWLVLIYPNIHINTKKVYEKYSFTLTKKVKKCSILALYNAQNSLIPWDEFLFNRLEGSAFSIAPELKNIKEKLKLYNVGALMSGSGSCIYALVKNKDIAFKIKRELQLNTNYDIWILKTK